MPVRCRRTAGCVQGKHLGTARPEAPGAAGPPWKERQAHLRAPKPGRGSVPSHRSPDVGDPHQTPQGSPSAQALTRKRLCGEGSESWAGRAQRRQRKVPVRHRRKAEPRALRKRVPTFLSLHESNTGTQWSYKGTSNHTSLNSPAKLTSRRSKATAKHEDQVPSKLLQERKRARSKITSPQMMETTKRA